MITTSGTAAIILAAGASSRFGGDVPKQYAYINGQPILEAVIKLFIDCEQITWVQPVIAQEDLVLYHSLIAPHAKLLPPVFGGVSRQESSKSGLIALEHLQPEWVLIHDAARPMVNSQIIHSVLTALAENHSVVDIGIPLTDTIKMHIPEGKIATLPREQLYATQTPQGFNYQKILAAHHSTKLHNATDDISLMIAAGHEVKVLEGDIYNRKITYSSDLPTNNHFRIGYGVDIHKFAPHNTATHIILGGVAIPHHQKIIAHSDGDVLLHALTDALLGAMAAGDIGDHFPDSDDRWKNADSSLLLQHVWQLLQKRGGNIVNIDITIICEQPKIGEFKLTISKNIAQLLRILPSQVSIKATTSEGIGFIGRGEGILVNATCLVIGLL